jgi:hypothetical protein
MPMSEATATARTTDPERGPGPDAPTKTSGWRLRAPSWLPTDPRRVVWAIVIAQAGWLLYLMSGGWYLQADLSNLSEAAASPLSWDYLTKSLGGHFSPVGRLAYWVLHRAAPMNYDVTIALRVVLQAVATLLLYRLLTRLVGRHPLVLVVLAAYALSPLVGPNLTYFTPGLGQTIGQVFAVAMYLALTRWAGGRQLRWAVATGVAMLLMILGDDQMIVLTLTVPVLTLAFLDAGSVGARIGRELRSWWGWLAMAVPTAAYVVVFVTGGYASSSGSSSLTLATVENLVKDEWLKAIGPLFVGGPLRWYAGPGNYVGFANPDTTVILLGQLVFVCLVALGVRRVGRSSLWAWVPLLLVAGAGIVLVGSGRFAAYGSTVPVTWRYSFPVAVPLALALALALLPGVRQIPAEVSEAEEPVARPEPAPAVQVYAGSLLAVGVLVTSLVSGVLYAQDWWRNPARTYTSTLVASARAAGPTALLYDSPVRGDVISALEPHHHISDLLALEGVPVTFDRPGGAPLTATDDGRLVKSTFVAAGVGAGPQQPACGSYVQGAGETVIPLNTTVRAGEWYLQLSLFQAQPSSVSIVMADADGHRVAPVAGAAQRLPALANLALRFPAMSPREVIVTSTSPDTSLCLVHVSVGAPFPAAG